MKNKKWVWPVLGIILLSGVLLMVYSVSQPKEVPPIINPGFETNLEGWASNGKIESGAVGPFA